MQVASPALRSSLVAALAPHAVRLACCRHGSPVLEAVLKYGNDADRELLLASLLGVRLGSTMYLTRHNDIEQSEQQGMGLAGQHRTSAADK